MCLPVLLSVASEPPQTMDASLDTTAAVVQTHHISKLFACDLCPKKYTLILRFHRHKKDHQTGKADTKLTDEVDKANSGWYCELCDKSGSSYHSLKRHETTHKEPDHKCNFCKKKFCFKGNFLRHQNTCHGNNECSFCKRLFPSVTILQSHQNTHKDEKHHGCSICGKRLTQSGNLKSHIRKHTGEKPFSCSLCEKPFRSKGLLEIHKTTHLKLKEII